MEFKSKETRFVFGYVDLSDLPRHMTENDDKNQYFFPYLSKFFFVESLFPTFAGSKLDLKRHHRLGVEVLIRPFSPMHASYFIPDPKRCLFSKVLGQFNLPMVFREIHPRLRD